jgi:hypothetical protein
VWLTLRPEIVEMIGVPPRLSTKRAGVIAVNRLPSGPTAPSTSTTTSAEAELKMHTSPAPSAVIARLAVVRPVTKLTVAASGGESEHGPG